MMTQEKSGYASYQSDANDQLKKLGISPDSLSLHFKKKTSEGDQGPTTVTATASLIATIEEALKEFSRTEKISEVWNQVRLFKVVYYNKNVLPALLGIREFSHPRNALVISDPELAEHRVRFIDALHRQGTLPADLWKEYETALRNRRRTENPSTPVSLNLNMGEVPTDDTVPEISDGALLEEFEKVLGSLTSVSALHLKCGQDRLPAAQTSGHFSSFRGILFQLDRQVKRKLAFWENTLPSATRFKLSKIVIRPGAAPTKDPNTLYQLEEEIGSRLVDSFLTLGTVRFPQSPAIISLRDTHEVKVADGLVWHMNFILAVAGNWSLHRGLFFSLWKTISELSLPAQARGEGQPQQQKVNMLGLLLGLIHAREAHFEGIHTGLEVMPFVTGLFTPSLSVDPLDMTVLLRLFLVGASFHAAAGLLFKETPGLFLRAESELAKPSTQKTTLFSTTDLLPPSPVPVRALRLFSCLQRRATFIDPRFPSPLQSDCLAVVSSEMALGSWHDLLEICFPTDVAVWLGIEFSLITCPTDFLYHSARQQALRTTLATHTNLAEVLQTIFRTTCDFLAGFGKRDSTTSLRRDLVVRIAASLITEICDCLVTLENDPLLPLWLRECCSGIQQSRIPEAMDLLVLLPQPFLFHGGFGYGSFKTKSPNDIFEYLLDTLGVFHRVLRGDDVDTDSQVRLYSAGLTSWILQGLLDFCQATLRSPKETLPCLLEGLVSTVPDLVTSLVVHFPLVRDTFSGFQKVSCCKVHQVPILDSLCHLWTVCRSFLNSEETRGKQQSQITISPSFQASLLLEFLAFEACQRTAGECRNMASDFGSALLSQGNKDLRREIFPLILSRLVVHFLPAETEGSLDVESLTMFFGPLQASAEREHRIFHLFKEIAVAMLEDDINLISNFPGGSLLTTPGWIPQQGKPVFNMDDAREPPGREALVKYLVLFSLLLRVRPAVLKEFAQLSPGGSLYSGFLLTSYAHLYRAAAPFPQKTPNSSPHSSQGAVDATKARATMSLRVLQAIETFVQDAVKTNGSPVAAVGHSVVSTFKSSPFGNLLAAKKKLEERNANPGAGEPAAKKAKTRLPSEEDMVNVFRRTR